MTSQYPTYSVTDKTQATSYTGMPDEINGVNTFVVTGTPDVLGQKMYADLELSPAPMSGSNPVTPTSADLVNVPPRHGENVAAPQYLPPVLVMNRMGATVPVAVNSLTSGPNQQFIRGDGADYYLGSKEWMLNWMTQVASTNIGTEVSTEVSAAILTANLATNSDIQNGNFAPGTSVVGPNTYVITGSTIGSIDVSIGNYYIFCNGDLTINSLGYPNGTVSTSLVIVATGNIVINDFLGFNTAPPSGSGTVIIAGGNLTIGSTNTAVPLPYHTGLMYGCVGNGTLNWGSGSPLTFTSAVYHRPNGSFTFSTTTEYTTGSTLSTGAVGEFTQHQLSTVSPVPQNVVIRTKWNDMWGPAAEQLDGSGVIAKYVEHQNVTSTHGTMWQEILDAYVLIFATQYNLGFDAFKTVINNGTMPSGSSVATPDNGTMEIRTTYMGAVRETMIVLQYSTSYEPNMGIHTTPFGFDNYVEPMMQTYRVSEDVYVPQSSGRYMTSSDQGYVVVSPSDFNVITTTYNVRSSTSSVATITIDKFTSESILSFPPTGSPTFEGGMDEFDSNWVSTYRALHPPFVTATSVTRVKAPYQSYFRYQPLNGKIVDQPTTEGGAVVDSDSNGMPIIMNSDRRSKVARVTFSVSPTWLTTSDGVKAGMNVASPLKFELTPKQHLTYLSDQMAMIHFDGKLYTVTTASSTTINGVSVSYAYSSSNNTGTVTGGDAAGVYPLVSVAPNDTMVTLEILFGDMVGEVSGRAVTTEVFEHFARTVEGLFMKNFASLDIEGTVNTVDLTFRTEEEIEAIRMGGFAISGTTATRFANNTASRKAGIVTVFGRRVVTYNDGDTEIIVPVADGTYGSVVVTGSKTAISNLPFSHEYITYIPKLATTVGKTINDLIEEVEQTSQEFLVEFDAIPNLKIVKIVGISGNLSIIRGIVDGRMKVTGVSGSGVSVITCTDSVKVYIFTVSNVA